MSTKSKMKNKRRSHKRLAKQQMRCYGMDARWSSGDPRKDKRAFRKMGMSDPVYEALNEGEALACYGPRQMPPRLRQNPYPPGRRHDAWESGYNNADPMGDHHGRNV